MFNLFLWLEVDQICLEFIRSGNFKGFSSQMVCFSKIDWKKGLHDQNSKILLLALCKVFHFITCFFRKVMSYQHRTKAISYHPVKYKCINFALAISIPIDEFLLIFVSEWVFHSFNILHICSLRTIAILKCNIRGFQSICNWGLAKLINLNYYLNYHLTNVKCIRLYICNSNI